MKKTRTSPSAVKPKGRLLSIIMMTACGAVLVSGFFLAGQQHFNSMDYGIKNSRLRKQIDELEAEKRRLLHAREVSLSPSEIKRVAKKAGLIEPTAPAPEMAMAVTKQPGRALPASSATSPAAAKPMVVKTAAVSPASAPAVTAAYVRTEKSERPVKRQLQAE